MTQRLCHQGSGWTLLSLLPLLLLLGAAPPAPPTKEAATPPHACCAAAPPTASRNALPETSLYRMQSVWQDQNGHEMHLSDLAGEVVFDLVVPGATILRTNAVGDCWHAVDPVRGKAMMATALEAGATSSMRTGFRRLACIAGASLGSPALWNSSPL